MIRWLKLWFLRQKMSRLASDINWKGQHLKSIELQILDLREDIAYGRWLIEQRHKELHLLQGQAFALESPRSIISSALRRIS